MILQVEGTFCELAHENSILPFQPPELQGRQVEVDHHFLRGHVKKKQERVESKCQIKKYHQFKCRLKC